MLKRLFLAAGLAASLVVPAFGYDENLTHRDAARAAAAKPGIHVEKAAASNEHAKLDVRHSPTNFVVEKATYSGGHIKLDVKHGGALHPVKRAPWGLDSYAPSSTGPDWAQGGRYNTRVAVLPSGCADVSCARQVTYSHNARVDAGATAIANDIGGTPVAAFKYVALSTNTSNAFPAKGDTTCGGGTEITTNGLARAVANYTAYTAPTSLGASASYTMTATWSPTATVTIGTICMFNAASGVTLGFEDLLGSSVIVNSGDTLSLSWIFNV